MSSDAGAFSPSELRYHSLETSTNCLSAFGRFGGSTTIAKYIPFAMCARTGAVQQWTMYTPGSFALNSNVFVAPGAMSVKAAFGAMRAAWKSTECGIGELLVSVTLTSCPWRTCTGDTKTQKKNNHDTNNTPGAICR